MKIIYRVNSRFLYGQDCVNNSAEFLEKFAAFSNENHISFAIWAFQNIPRVVFVHLYVFKLSQWKLILTRLIEGTIIKFSKYVEK